MTYLVRGIVAQVIKGGVERRHSQGGREKSAGFRFCRRLVWRLVLLGVGDSRQECEVMGGHRPELELAFVSEEVGGDEGSVCDRIAGLQVKEDVIWEARKPGVDVLVEGSES